MTTFTIDILRSSKLDKLKAEVAAREAKMVGMK